VSRLNWGCGSHVAEGWINSDIKDGPGIDLVADIRKGLPLAGESLDYAVTIHALPEFAYPELRSVLRELRRTLKPGGVSGSRCPISAAASTHICRATRPIFKSTRRSWRVTAAGSSFTCSGTATRAPSSPSTSPES